MANKRSHPYDGSMVTSSLIRRAREICALPGFGAAELWLTFYLTAAPARLDELARLLTGLGALNLDDTEGGFLYAKLPVANDPSAMLLGVDQVLKFASACKVEVLSVDVDTTSDVRSSLFKELARFEPSDR